uniref:Uncharacterized protein n=1 Tax=Aegilops tauschii subsp. strangulata TaxID=200361 RepID=A0A453IM81_AEGTS
MGVIGALVKVATFIVQRIISDDLGLRYMCTNAERLLAVVQILAQMVNSERLLAVASVQRDPAKLVKHVIRCFHGLSADARGMRCIANHPP